jgi:hypothetical protein
MAFSKQGIVPFQMSITADASGLMLSGDEAAPGNNQVYGTDGAGAKGWKDDPSGGSADGWIDTGDTWSQYSEAFTFPGSAVSVAFTGISGGNRLTVASTTGFEVGQRVKMVSDGGGTTYTNVTQITTNTYIYVTSAAGHNTTNAYIYGTLRALAVADTYGFYVGQLVTVSSTAGSQVHIISAITENTSITVTDVHTLFHNDSADFLISPIVTVANTNNTYVAAVITTGDETGKYLPGRKVKFTQGGGTLYGIVLESRIEPDDETDTVITLFGGEDNAIRHRQALFDRETRGIECEYVVERYHSPLPHHCDRFQCDVLPTLCHDALENFEQGERWNDELRRRLDRLGKRLGVRAVGEVLEPARGVDHVHTRSGSRGTSVLMPLRNPRALFTARTGTSATWPR